MIKEETAKRTTPMPNAPDTVNKIYEWHVTRSKENPHHGRLGASQIGHPCERYLWYKFRGLCQERIPGRVYRLFETGHLEEARFINELRAIGCEVHDVDTETGKQFAFYTHSGHFVCHPDALCKGIPEAPATWHICEFKTMGGTEDQKSKDFEKVSEYGVKSAKPQHYAQMMCGMGLSGLKRALYLTKKKATDELYAERIEFDGEYFNLLMERAKRIITIIQPPERCAVRSDDFRCKWCDAFELCWGMGKSVVPIPKKTCRSCCHATPIVVVGDDSTDAMWTCSLDRCNIRDIGYEEQMNGCDNHIVLPGLVEYADPIDGGNGWIEFTNRDNGIVWHHGNQHGMWTTEDLMASLIPLQGDRNPIPLIDRYPAEDSRLRWDGEMDSVMIESVLHELLKVPDNDRLPDHTNCEKTDYATAVEYANKFLVVVYHQSNNHVAVWEGVD